MKSDTSEGGLEALIVADMTGTRGVQPVADSVREPPDPLASLRHWQIGDPHDYDRAWTLDLVQFVDLADIDAMYFDKPYFVVPADDLAEEAFIVLRDALRAAKKVGVGQLAMRGQEYVVALKP